MKSVESPEEGVEKDPVGPKGDPLDSVSGDEDLAKALHARYNSGAATGADHRWLSDYHRRRADEIEEPEEEEAEADPYSGIGD